MTAASRSVFDELVGQERVAAFLSAAVRSGSVSHAYLFVGPSGTGKRAAAVALACALVCDEEGCGTCSACVRARKGAHPDVRFVAPEGAASYLVEQVREDLVPDMWLSPVEASVKVYILDAAESLGDAAANAFLKTLEEPPSDVHIILLTEDYDSVLPTVSSRCQVVRFAPIPPSRAVALLAERTGVGSDEALAALAAASGDLPRAIEFVEVPARREARDAMVTALRDLGVMDGRDVLATARDLLRQVKAPLDEVKARQSAELAERVEFMGRAAGVKEAEQRNKRELTARERESVLELVAVAESWLRDVLAASAGATGAVVNRDALDDIAEAGSCMTHAAIEQALDAVRRARRRVSYNVSPQLAVEVMLFEIQEARTCPRSWGSL